MTTVAIPRKATMSTREHLHSLVTTLQPVVNGGSAEEKTAPLPCAGSAPDDAAPFDKVLAQAGRELEWSAP